MGGGELGGREAPSWRGNSPGPLKAFSGARKPPASWGTVPVPPKPSQGLGSPQLGGDQSPSPQSLPRGPEVPIWRRNSPRPPEAFPGARKPPAGGGTVPVPLKPSQELCVYCSGVAEHPLWAAPALDIRGPFQPLGEECFWELPVASVDSRAAGGRCLDAAPPGRAGRPALTPQPRTAAELTQRAHPCGWAQAPSRWPVNRQTDMLLPGARGR